MELGLQEPGRTCDDCRWKVELHQCPWDYDYDKDHPYAEDCCDFRNVAFPESRFGIDFKRRHTCMENIKIKTVYVVIVSSECDDSYYPDYDHIYCICSTKEKAKEVVDKLIEKNENEDPYFFAGARVVGYGLDEIPEELNDD